MQTSGEFSELVKQAHQGNEASRDQLASLVRVRLEEYVYRLTLQEDTTQDIVQETLLTMFKVLGKLRNTDRFWPWIYKIAFTQTLKTQKEHKRQRDIIREMPKTSRTDDPQGLTNLVNQELQQVVMQAIGNLKPRHRQILDLRCYADMEYKDIAKIIDCSEFGTRLLFGRAKNALQKQLSRFGFKKGAFFTALIVFGKMTARSEASASGPTVAAGSLKVGAAAVAAGALGTKAGILSVLATGMVVAGAGITFSGNVKEFFQTSDSQQRSGNPVLWHTTAQAQDRIEELWFYYPTGDPGPVMLRTIAAKDNGGYSYCQWLQNARYNYFYDRRKNTVFLQNHRMWQPDLSVLRLPTDAKELTAFFTQVEGIPSTIEYVESGGPGLWIQVKLTRHSDEKQVTVERDFNILKTEFFRYPWPADVNEVDQRDAMHQRGWTFFRIEGHIKQRPIQGNGCIPFVTSTYANHPPRLYVTVGDQVFIHTNETQGGSYFKGLSRPWMGLHTIDIIRRDAAEAGIWFETRRTNHPNRVEIELRTATRSLVYFIDLEKDVIEKILFLTPAREKEGELKFEYLQDVEHDSKEFNYGRLKQEGELLRTRGKLWLLELAMVSGGTIPSP